MQRARFVFVLFSIGRPPTGTNSNPVPLKTAQTDPLDSGVCAQGEALALKVACPDQVVRAAHVIESSIVRVDDCQRQRPR